MNDNPSIDESCYRYIIRQYLNHWKQKLSTVETEYWKENGWLDGKRPWDV